MIHAIQPNRLRWRRRRPIPRAFTLIELFVVVVVLSILAGSVVVALHGRGDTYALDASVRDLSAAIRFAVTEARLQHRRVRVHSPDQWRSYRVEVLGAQGQYQPAGGMAGVARALPGDVTVTAITEARASAAPLPDSLVFEPTGNGFAGTVRLSSRGGSSVDVTIVPGSGQVHVSE